MWSTLGEISSIRTATVFRDQSPKVSVDGNVRALTIKDVVNDWPQALQRLDLIEIDNSYLKNCLSPGEVLIPSRGEYYPSRYFFGSSEPVFPLGQINVITPSPQVVGVYLSWYLNQPHSQHKIKRLLTGTNIKSLTKPNLASLKIFLPEIQIQYEIANLQEMFMQNKTLKMRLLELEELEIEEVCRRLLQDAEL